MAGFKFAKEKENVLSKEHWKVLIVDDDSAVHSITKTVLSNFELEGKDIEFLSAYSGKEAIEVLKENKNIAVVLLDVIMEDDDAGLVVAKKIREELHNNLIRIILRTGQPGNAPEEEVIVKYKINDYKDKADLTVNKLFTTMVTALRSYEDLESIQNHKEGLEKIISATKFISQEKSLSFFIEIVLNELISILNINMDLTHKNSKNNALFIKNYKGTYEIVSSLGKYETITKFDDIDDETKKTIQSLSNLEKIEFLEDSYIGNFRFNDDTYYLVYISGCKNVDKKLIEIFSNNIAVAFNNLSLNQDIIDTQEEVIERLGEVVEKRSHEASGHIHRVAEFSYMLGIDYGLTKKEANLLRMASPMHDVGKIGISDSILLKPGKLTDEEFEVMKTHSLIGYKVLKSSKRELLKTAAIIAYEHHEKYDGTGYPCNKKGEDIHIFARITSIIDVFDALSHKRCYKDSWSEEEIVKYFKEQRGKHFDPSLVDIILNNLDKYNNILDPNFRIKKI